MGARTASILSLVASACFNPLAQPKTNEVIGKTAGRKIEFRDKVSSGTFCPTCGRDAPIILAFGTPPRIVVTIPLCYAHAALKTDGKDHFTVEDQVTHATGSGELDVVDCMASHVIGTLKAEFDSGLRIQAKIDTDLVPPGSDSASGSGH
jgi:hypothetical protein